ncbi:unnamed protein product [Diamesa hyperborea]
MSVLKHLFNMQVIKFLLFWIAIEVVVAEMEFESFEPYSGTDPEFMSYGTLRVTKKSRHSFVISGDFEFKRNIGDEITMKLEFKNDAGVTLISISSPFCEFTKKNKSFWPGIVEASNMPQNNPCPLPKGSYTLKDYFFDTKRVPRTIPPGKYAAKVSCKPKFFDDRPSAMTDSRAMDDSSTILQLFQKANKRVLRLFDQEQFEDNNEDVNHTFGIEVLNKSDSENDENIEIPETQSQEPESTEPNSVYQQSRRDGLKSLNVKNLSPIDICTISLEGSTSRSISSSAFKEPTPRSPIHKKSIITKPNTSLRRSVFKPNVVPDFANFVCSTPRNGDSRQQFQDSITMSPIRSNSSPVKNTNTIQVRSMRELQNSILNTSDNGNSPDIEVRRKSVQSPVENVFKIPPTKTSDFVARRSSVDSVVSKKSKPASIGEIEPALLQQYDIHVTKTPTKRSSARISNTSLSPVSNRSNRNTPASINMDVDNNDIAIDQPSRRKSINQTDYRTINMAETPVQSNITTHNRDAMLLMKNKLAICETDDEDDDEAMDEVADINESEIMDEDIDVYEEEVIAEQVETEVITAPLYETPKKSLFKRPGTPLQVAILNAQEIRKNPIRLERITSSSDNDMTNNVSPSLLASFRNLPVKRKSNEKTTDTVDFEITSSQPEEASLALPKKKRKKAKELENNRMEYGHLVTELQKKNKTKSQDTTVRKRTLYCRESSVSPRESRTLRSSKNLSATPTKETNKSASDIELDLEMSRIHRSYQQVDKAVTPQKKSPVKKVVAAKTTELRIVTRSKQKADPLNEQSDSSEEETEAEVVVTNKKTPKQKTQEIHSETKTNKKSTNSRNQQEVDSIRKNISYRKDSTESDSSQEEEPVTNVVKEKNSNQQKTREVEVNRNKKSTHSEPVLDESDSSQDPEPIVKDVKKRAREVEVNHNKKSTHRELTVDESDSSQDPEPVVEVKKSTKQKKTREPVKKSTNKEPTLEESDSSQDPEPIVEVKKSTKQKKTQKPEINVHKTPTHREPTVDESDSSQDPEPIVEVKKSTKQKKTREPVKKSTHKEPTLDESDSQQDPEPIVTAAKKKTTKQQKTKDTIDRSKKTKQKEPTSEESDASQDPEPVVITMNTKTKQRSPDKRESIIIRNNEMSYRSYISEAESSEEQEPVVAPTVSKKSNKKKMEQDAEVSKKRLKEPSEKKSNVIKKSEIARYEKPSPLCKKKYSRIVRVESDSDDDDEYQIGQSKQQTKAIEPVFKVPEVPKRHLTKQQKKLSRELEGLKIKHDRELMSEFDEGIEINDDEDHANSPGIYRNVYRVADCERKLRVRRLYSRPYWMHGEHQFGIRYSTLNPDEEVQKSQFNKKLSKKNTNFLENCLNLTDHQLLIDEQTSEHGTRDKRSRSRSKEPRKQKKQKRQHNESSSTDYGGSTTSAQFVSSSNQQLPTIHEFSSSIAEEAVSYANLMTRFQDFGKNVGSSNTSEASTSSSTRVHSNFLDMAQMEDLNFTECGDGILFGKYVDAANCGVIQFLAGKKRDRAKTKRSNIKLLLLSGELEVTVANEVHILKPMGFMIIHCGTEYEMRNSYKGVSMVFFMREDSNQVSTSSSSGNSTTKK